MRAISEETVKKLICQAHELDQDAYKLLIEISELTDYKNEEEHKAIILAAYGRMATEHLFAEIKAA